ncbi:Nn.00g026540.m01.CDS01 [Neocucurbitaria sp. VM-36]
MLKVLGAACNGSTSTKQANDSAEDADLMMANDEPAEKLIEKFISLAETLEFSKAVALRFGSAASEQGASLTRAWNDALEDAEETARMSFARRMELLDSPSVREGLVHPLSVALLAYHLGGPINAANTACGHIWKLPKLPVTEELSFHKEGDNGDFFEGCRITLVWETQHGEMKSASGKHHVFLTGDATPRPLRTMNTVDGNDTAPLSIIYDSKSAALYYDCPDPEAIRHSVTVEFHLNTILDDDIQLLSAQCEQKDFEELTLTKLVTKFPIANYSALFHHLLFNTESLNAIAAKLSTLDISRPEPLPHTCKHPIKEAFEGYKKENWARVPPTIKSMEADVRISGTYSAPARFLDRLCIKACRSVHLPIGLDLFPQTTLEGNIESARKSIRDLPSECVEMRLVEYGPALLVQYTSLDLLSTMDLHRLATLIGRRCLELISMGFVDAVCNLPSIAALAPTLGKALNGPIEIQVSQEPWVDESDLQVYGTRCLYLFWCADWLVCYLEKPDEGPFMLVDIKKDIDALRTMRADVHNVSQLLLRNWVAWGLFVEGLPKGGFFVRRPTGFELAG